MTLLDSIREVMNDRETMKKYPKGISAAEMLEEVQLLTKDGFPLVSVLDVADEMRSFFGKGS